MTITMSSEKILVPKLRFPEFLKDDVWKEIELGKLCEYWNGASHENGVNDYGEYFLISLNSLDINGNLKNEMKRLSFTDNSLQKNDLVMVLSDVAHGNFLGLTDIIPCEKYVLNQRMAGLRIKDHKQINSFFLRSYINKNQQYFKSKGQGSSQLNLSKSSVTEFIVKFPKNLKEQQKIASCLSSLDNLIAAHTEKLYALQDHKKGLMQNLFPQEGETVPKFRFPEFKNEGDWVKSKLGSLGKFLGGGTPDKSVMEFWEGSIPWISSSDINDNDIHRISISRFINDEALKQSATKLIPMGSILFVSRVGVGKLAINQKELCTSQDFTNFLPDKVLNYYIGYYFSANKHLLQNLNQGTSIKGFSKGDLENFVLLYPKNRNEQEKIASCLSAVDELIVAQTTKIDELKLHKKGLMQGLFPNMND